MSLGERAFANQAEYGDSKTVLEHGSGEHFHNTYYGNTATLARGQANMVFRVVFFYSWINRRKNKKNLMMPDLDTVL